MEETGSRTIILTGSESTGKTTVAEALTKYYKGILVPEFARDFVTGLDHAYTSKDILTIADWQYSQMKILRKDQAGTIAFFDTYLIITKIWLVWFQGKYPKWIDDAIAETSDSLYLLCNTDLDWIADGVRENGGDARERLFEEYQKELEKFKLNFRIVSGHDEKRISCAMNYVNEYLKNDGKKI